MSKLFTGARHAKLYSQFRPRYTKDVFDNILRFCREGGSRFEFALDIGCGSGQSTVPLAAHYQRVLGVDPSEKQIEQASQALQDLSAGPAAPTNVTYRLGSAEDLSEVKDGSVDLITVAQALHWLDTSKFYKEVQRVLHPGGVLAAYGYGNVKLDNIEANEAIWQHYTETVGPYWERGRRHIDNHLADFKFPLQDFKRIDSLSMIQTMSIANFCGYLRTWSAYQALVKEDQETNVIHDLQNKFLRIYRTNSADHEITATWPIFILLGRNVPSHSTNHAQ